MPLFRRVLRTGGNQIVVATPAITGSTSVMFRVTTEDGRTCCCPPVDDCGECVGCPWTVMPDVTITTPDNFDHPELWEPCGDIFCGDLVGVGHVMAMTDTSASPVLRTIGCIIDGIDGTTPNQDVSPLTFAPTFETCDELNRSTLSWDSYEILQGTPGTPCVYVEAIGDGTYTKTITPEIWFIVNSLFVRVTHVCLEPSNEYGLVGGPYTAYEVELNVTNAALYRQHVTNTDTASSYDEFDCVGTTAPDGNYLMDLLPDSGQTFGTVSNTAIDDGVYFVGGCARNGSITIELQLNGVENACGASDPSSEPPRIAYVAFTF